MKDRSQRAPEEFELAIAAALAARLQVDHQDVEVAVHAPGAAALRPEGSLTLKVPEPVTEVGSNDGETPSSGRVVLPPAGDEVTLEELEEEADAAADFLEGLLDALDLPGDLRLRVEEGYAEVEVVDIGNGVLIGRRGQTLDALQEIVRCSMQRRFERRSRVRVDAEGYRSRRMERLVEKVEEAIDAVLDSGEPERLEPMDVFERKIVHRMVGEVAGLQSRSQGREPSRRVVVELE